MDARIKRLLDVLDQTWAPVPKDLAAALKLLPDAGSLLPPWETWALIGFVRHRKRQYWVRDIIHTRLRGSTAALGSRGAFGHPADKKQSGPVPGLPEWEYYFHGRGCCLTHKVAGERIDVDFWDDTADYFEVFFYEQYLKSLREPEPPEQRVLELHRSVAPIKIAVANLLAMGAMHPMPGRTGSPPRIADEVLTHSRAIEQFCRAWSESHTRVWIAALIGDWIAADSAAGGDAQIREITSRQAERCRAMRREQLLQVQERYGSDALYGLADLGNADDQLEVALLEAHDSKVSAALGIIDKDDDQKWCPHVHRLFRRTRPDGPIPEPYIWITALKFLLRHNYCRDEIIPSLARAGGPEVGEAVLLAMENAPEYILLLIRRALCSDTPCNRTTVAAILALIAKPWSIRELLGALDASDDQQKTADARAALLQIGGVDAEKSVRAWEEANPHESEQGTYVEIDGRRMGPLYSMAEHMLPNRAAFIRYEMDQLRDRVVKFKDLVPAEFPDRTI